MRIFFTSKDGKRYINSEFLLNAYCNGMFPMAEGREGEIHWFSPERRGVFPLDGLIISRSLRQRLRKNDFIVKINSDFELTMRLCADREDVWISETIIQSYTRLHLLGFSHSVEVWQNESMVGGLYGVAIKGAFFGESMFNHTTDMSKIALVYLVERLKNRGYTLLDAQYLNPHLASLGCIEISKEEYLHRLQTALTKECTFI